MILQIVIRFFAGATNMSHAPLMGFRCRFFNGNKLLVEDFANRNEGPDGSALPRREGEETERLSERL